MKINIHPIILATTFAVLTIFSAGAIVFAWQAGNAEMTSMAGNLTSATASSTKPLETVTREKTPKQTVKAIYLTAYSAGSPKKIDQIIDLIEHTELNAVVMDIKDYSGYVLYDSKLPLINKLHLKDNRYHDLAATVKKLHDHNIYVIARETVFQDPVLAERKPEWALKSKSGGLWRDRKGLAWVDASKKDVWNYDVAIAREAASYGFDEINFDYVRFPSDGNISQIIFSNGSSTKYAVMGQFYSYLGDKLKDEPVWLSLDMFGFVMDKKGTDDMNIGQRLADAVGAVDYVCPMMYPSHYPAGYIGLKNPAASPGKVIDYGMTKGLPKFENAKAEFRPWLQAFNMGAVYDAAKIREQIDTVEQRSSSGWMLWNASNRYTSAGLKGKQSE